MDVLASLKEIFDEQKARLLIRYFQIDSFGLGFRLAPKPLWCSTRLFLFWMWMWTDLVHHFYCDQHINYHWDKLAPA